MLDRWSTYRQQQRGALRASYRDTGGAAADTGTAQDPRAAAAARPADPTGRGADLGADPEAETPPLVTPPAGATAAGRDDDHHYGRAGRPLNRQSPFFVGFVGALGVLVAYWLAHAVTMLTTVLTLLLVAFFLTLALNPLVEALTRRGIRRPGAVSLVFLGLIGVFTALGLLVIPPVVNQAGQLVDNLPGYLNNLLKNDVVQRLDSQYHIVSRFQAELEKRVTSGDFVGTVFGGVLGAGKAVASGVFSALTVLILTLYFLSSLPRVKHAAYGMVPASRRPRFMSLSEEIMRRVGSYAIGQVTVATINAVASFVMMTIIGLKYAAVLAVVVGFLGLIPMVGATLGAAVVCLVAFFDEPKKALIALIYYIVYQQIENYVVAPRIMMRTVSVPGAVTVVAALAGGTLLGVLGALLAIPVAAGLLLIYEEVLVPRQRRS